MLFEDHLLPPGSPTLSKHVMATFGMVDESIALLVSYKDTITNDVYVSLFYLKQDGSSELKLNKTMQPSSFEKFYYELGVTVGDIPIREFSFRTRTIDNPHTVIFEDKEKNIITYKFLKNILCGISIDENYDNIKREAVLLRAAIESEE